MRTLGSYVTIWRLFWFVCWFGIAKLLIQSVLIAGIVAEYNQIIGSLQYGYGRRTRVCVVWCGVCVWCGVLCVCGV